MKFIRARIFACFVFLPALSFAQGGEGVLRETSLQACIEYALANQPSLQQTLAQQQIVDAQVRSGTSGWWPQVSATGSYQYDFELPTTIFNGSAIQIGARNTSAVQLAASQTLFDRGLWLSSRSARPQRTEASQQVVSAEIDLVVNVGKAYYDVLLAMGQIGIAGDDILRLERSLRDARARYDDGLSDNTDYKQAAIMLGNARVRLTQSRQDLDLRLSVLKEQMGYPPAQPLTLRYDSLQLVSRIAADTLTAADYTRRVEYGLLQTRMRLQEIGLHHARWSYIPSVSLFAAYNLDYMNSNFHSLYGQAYPNSFAGVTLSLPIFQGLKRSHDIKAAKLQLKQYDYGMRQLESSVDVEYSRAMADYKTYLDTYLTAQGNLELAREIYAVVDLQYRAGVKTYLDVITAETNLRNAQQNYLLALFRTLVSKIELQRSRGEIDPHDLSGW